MPREAPPNPHFEPAAILMRIAIPSEASQRRRPQHVQTITLYRGNASTDDSLPYIAVVEVVNEKLGKLCKLESERNHTDDVRGRLRSIPLDCSAGQKRSK